MNIYISNIYGTGTGTPFLPICSHSSTPSLFSLFPFSFPLSALASTRQRHWATFSISSSRRFGGTRPINYFYALTMLVCRQEENPKCKNRVMGCWLVICLERGAHDLHMVQLMPLPPHFSCFIKTQTGLAFPGQPYPGFL